MAALFTSLSWEKWSATLAGLREQMQELQSAYADAEPFPHVVIDGLLDDEFLDGIAEEFPDLADKHWHATTSPNGGKKYTGLIEELGGPLTHILVQRLNSKHFIDCLETITGIHGLISDSQPQMHLAHRDSELDVHVDGSKSGRTGLHRRLTMFFYLNRDWSKSYAGDLELWNEDASACVKRIAPVFNRLVIVLNTDQSYHGFPRPLQCPDGTFRRAISLRYFTAKIRKGERAALRKPNFGPQDQPIRSIKIRKALRRITPSILIDLIRRIRL